MDDWIVKRNNLQEEKNELLEEREKIITTSYDVAVRILRNLDEFESYTILESFFKDIVDLKTGDWSRQMTLEQQEKTIIDLRKTLLAMRRAAVLTTSEYEKKNRELEEALRFDERSSSPSAPEKRELQMDDIENSTSNAT
ncbi:hypothetical protein RhiirB3_511994 [Rhizophagus irregularis]|nr:hypothetical protein RhiirB3_511994 [Rhizophagus irregularis]